MTSSFLIICSKSLKFYLSSGNVLPPTSDDLKDATISMVGGAPLYRLPLDGLIVSDICPTLDGRIFFSADDSLFELEYFVCLYFTFIS